MTAGELSTFGVGGSNSIFKRSAYPNSIFFKIGTVHGDPENPAAVTAVQAFKSDDHSIWSDIPADEQVEACVNFELTCFKDGGGAFFLSA